MLRGERKGGVEVIAVFVCKVFFSFQSPVCPEQKGGLEREIM